MTTNYTKWPQKSQTALKFTTIYHSNDFKNVPNLANLGPSSCTDFKVNFFVR
jgi:hypothetical protein